MKIIPFGSKIIVLPLQTENFKTKGGLEVVETKLATAEVIEVGDDYVDVLKKGDKVLYPEGSGDGIYYNGQQCIWLDARPVNENGDLWAKID